MGISTTGGSSRYFWSMTLRDLLFIVCVADLMFVSKTFVSLPMHLPGHTGLLWVALLIAGRGIVDKRGAGTLIGVVSGFLDAAFARGQYGPLGWMKLVAAGVTLDVTLLVLRGDLRNRLLAAVAGATAHLAKLLSMVLVGLVLQIRLQFLALGLGPAALTHVVFGAFGGLLGALLLHELKRVPLFGGGSPPAPGPDR